MRELLLEVERDDFAQDRQKMSIYIEFCSYSRETELTKWWFLEKMYKFMPEPHH